jgi:hypothetical protein
MLLLASIVIRVLLPEADAAASAERYLRRADAP